MKENLCYELYEIINDKRLKNLSLTNKQTNEELEVEDITVGLIYRDNSLYLSLSKTDFIEVCDEYGEFLRFEDKEIVNINTEDKDIEEIEIFSSIIVIRTSLYSMALTIKIG